MQATSQATDAPDTVPQLWVVDLEVNKFHGALHTWTGYACNSIEATIEAKLDWFGRTGEDTNKPLRVRSCMQVGV